MLKLLCFLMLLKFKLKRKNLPGRLQFPADDANDGFKDLRFHGGHWALERLAFSFPSEQHIDQRERSRQIQLQKDRCVNWQQPAAGEVRGFRYALEELSIGQVFGRDKFCHKRYPKISGDRTAEVGGKVLVQGVDRLQLLAPKLAGLPGVPGDDDRLSIGSLRASPPGCPYHGIDLFLVENLFHDVSPLTAQLRQMPSAARGS